MKRICLAQYKLRRGSKTLPRGGNRRTNIEHRLRILILLFLLLEARQFIGCDLRQARFADRVDDTSLIAGRAGHQAGLECHPEKFYPAMKIAMSRLCFT